MLAPLLRSRLRMKPLHIFFQEGIPHCKITSRALKNMTDAFINVGRAGVEVTTTLQRTLPTRAKLSGELLDRVHGNVVANNKTIHGPPAATFSVTVSTDGFTDVSGHNIINIVITTSAGHLFVDASDATAGKKTAPFLKSFIEESVTRYDLAGGMSSVPRSWSCSLASFDCESC
jgi:hypothetical protein